MKNYFLFLCILLSSSLAQAHQPDLSSTMLVEQKDGSWILQIRAALTAFEYEVKTHYGKDAYATPKQFQDLVISHLKDNLAIGFGENAVIELKNAYVKLGHETNAVFEVIGVPKTFTSVSLQNSSFKDIHRNQSAFFIIKKGINKKQFVLNDKNQHQVKLEVNDSNLVLMNDTNDSQTIPLSPYWLITGVIGLLIFLFGLIYLNRYRLNNSNKAVNVLA